MEVWEIVSAVKRKRLTVRILAAIVLALIIYSIPSTLTGFLGYAVFGGAEEKAAVVEETRSLEPKMLAEKTEAPAFTAEQAETITGAPRGAPPPLPGLGLNLLLSLLVALAAFILVLKLEAVR